MTAQTKGNALAPTTKGHLTLCRVRWWGAPVGTPTCPPGPRETAGHMDGAVLKCHGQLRRSIGNQNKVLFLQAHVGKLRLIKTFSLVCP